MVKVETTCAGFNHYVWDVESRDEAEQFARWLSIKDADNPIYPNPYFVVTDGHPAVGFHQGKRLPV